MSHATPSSADPLRKLAIVAVLVGGMVVLYRFSASGQGDFDPTGMLALGFVILASYAVGQLVEIIGLPHITGYLTAGLLLGPSVAGNLPDGWRVPPFRDGILNEQVIGQLSLLNALAIALIALTAGGEIRLDTVRHGFRQILGTVGGQIAVVFPAVALGMYLVGGIIPAIAFEPLAAVPAGHVLAYAILAATVICATSPAVAIAVISETNADGPMTRTMLSSVVLHDVTIVTVFSVVGGGVATLVGITASDGSVLGYLLQHIGLSLLLGSVLAGLLHAYIRYIGNEILLFLVGLIYIGTFIAGEIHADPILTFVVAGLIASNFSAQSSTLIHSVERLSLPVYVVFFTLAGAKLHVEAVVAMAPFAVAMVGLRAAGTWVGVSAGARLTGADPAVQRYGWLAFLPQAGVALSLAALVGNTYGEIGRALETLIISGIALNEMAGPILFKAGLGFAGEVGARERADAAPPPETEPTLEVPRPERLKAWEAPADVGNPWGPAANLSSPRLNQLVDDVEAELQTLVRDLLQGPLERFRIDANRYLKSLRREFLRHHRRALVQAQSKNAAELPGLLRAEQADLAARWRGIVLDRGARNAQDAWSPTELVEVIDQLVESLPEMVDAPWEPESFVSPDDESPITGIQRAVLRLRRRTHAIGGGELPPREVGVRNLARYHFSGRVPERAEAIAALLVTADAHLSSRTRSLFDAIIRGYDTVARSVERLDPERIGEKLWAVRTEVEEEFALAVEEVDRIAQEGAVRTARVLGEALQRLKEELRVSDTLDLPRRSRRFSTVYNARVRGLQTLGPRLDATRRTTAARYTVLALELELVALERRIKDAVDEHGNQLARTVRGRGATQLARVDAALAEALERLEDHLADASLPGQDMALALRADAEPLARVVAEASRSATRLRDDLGNEEIVEPLLDALLGASQVLTEHYVVPTGPSQYGEWNLPTAIATIEVPFREVVIAYIESSVTRNLIELTRELSEEVRRIAQVLEELERIVAFNVELAGAELEVLQKETVASETTELVREMVVGALVRSRNRLNQLREQAEGLHDRAREGVRAAVLDGLEALRAQVVDGRVSELRLRLLREAATARNLARDAEQLKGLLSRSRDRGVRVLRAALGEDRLEIARQRLGLPPTDVAGAAPATFAPPAPAEHLPMVYRRLFSDQALEAGDLLTGRQAEISRARAALTGARGGRLRAVAVIGMDGVGKGAVVNALVRQIKPRGVKNHTLEAPATVADVEAWFERGTEDDLVVVDGFQWLFTLEPGGFAPLRRLIDGIVADDGRNAWLLDAEVDVWEAAAAAAPLAQAFADVVRLDPLGADELGAAVLARHSMSGYGLRFEAQDDLGWQLQHLLARRSDQDDRRREAWIRTLHAATNGVIRDALLLWMASIRKVDDIEGVVRVGPAPRPPLAALRALDDDVLLALRAALRQGWTSADLHARIFRVSGADARAHLAQLAHLGLLVPVAAGRYKVPGHLKSPVGGVLRERRWM